MLSLNLRPPCSQYVLCEICFLACFRKRGRAVSLVSERCVPFPTPDPSITLVRWPLPISEEGWGMEGASPASAEPGVVENSLVLESRKTVFQSTSNSVKETTLFIFHQKACYTSSYFQSHLQLCYNT